MEPNGKENRKTIENINKTKKEDEFKLIFIEIDQEKKQRRLKLLKI